MTVPLPGLVLERLPLLTNVLPARFAVVVDLCCAWMVALFLSEIPSMQGAPRAAGSFLAAVAIISWLPVVPVPTTRDNTPPFFEPGGEASRLPAGTVVLALPYADGSSMLWQARGGFHIRLAEALAITATFAGTPTFFTPGPVNDAYRPIQESGALPAESDASRAAVLGELRDRRVALIALGPAEFSEQLASYTTWLVGAPPRFEGGVEVWSVPPPG